MARAEALFVSCTPGLEGPLEEEVQSLSLQAQAEPGGVHVQGPAGTFELCNLWLRTAGRVLLRLGEVRGPDELKRLSLSPYRAAGQELRLEVSGERPDMWSRAATAAFGGQASHGRSQPDGATPDDALAVYLRTVQGVCTVSVDTSGAPLHLRGYRQEVGRAPMRETLAAAMLRLGEYQPALPLWDVMCGSGTLLVEAAEMALGLAPGRQRHFAFERYPSHDAAAFAARPRQRDGVTPTIVGTDLNSGALGTARRNAKRAGVLPHLTLERQDATRLVARALTPGLVVANLPYGKRVGEKSELGALYRDLGKALKHACPGWRFAFLLEEGGEQLSLPVEVKHRLANGGLACELLVGAVPA